MNQQPFVSIKDAATISGLSQNYLRQGVKAGTVPAVFCGRFIKINMPLLLQQLGVPESEVKTNGR